jgi:glycosyltransferase domain-containing protein
MKLTIVLTLKDRIEFTYRWLKYMNDVKCPYKILIADGGESLEIEKHLKNTHNYPNLVYDYIRYPVDENLDLFYKKLADVFSLVLTDYVLWADNDDFFLLDHVEKMIQFLDFNPDYIGARGSSIDFEIFDEMGNSENTVQGKSYFATELSSPSIEQNSIYDRIQFLGENILKYNFYNNCYCLLKSSNISKIYANLSSLAYKSPIPLEILMNLMIVHAGKIKIYPYPYYIRQVGTSQYGDHAVSGNRFIEDAIRNNSFSVFFEALNKFFIFETTEERLRVEKSLGQWIFRLIISISNNNEFSNKNIFRFFQSLKKNIPINILFRIKPTIRIMLIFIKKLIWNYSPKVTIVSLNQIEKYILEEKS